MPNWRDICISKDMSLTTGMRVIDDGGMRLAVVTDGDSKLLGTITDGDIRRALLKNLPLETPVSEVMNTNPIHGEVGDSDRKLLTLLNAHSLISIPILDDSRKVVSIETIRELSQQKRLDNPIVLMAGGFGSRLYPLTEDTPKPMLKVGERPLLETIIEEFAAAGFHDFYITTHFMPDAIKDHFGDGSQRGISITYLHEEAPLGTGGALGLLPKNLPDLPLILMNGDILTKVDFHGMIKFHEAQNAVITVGSRKFQSTIPYGVMDIEGTSILKIIEKPTKDFFVNAGIYVLSPEVYKTVGQDQKLDMPDLLTECIKSDQTVASYPIHEYWMDIGLIPDYEQAQKEFPKIF